MMNATEMREITNKAIAAHEERKRAMIASYVEEQVAPLIEEAAKDGKYGVLIRKPQSIDFMNISAYLAINGYKAENASSDQYSVRW